METTCYMLYLLFTASWFLHLGTRIPALGVIRFDLILVLTIGLVFIGQWKNRLNNIDTDKILGILILYILIAVPFTEWPGTVIRFGIVEFIRAVVFYYFTISFITTEKRLKVFLIIYLTCQSIRIFEPLYLHVTANYWGDLAIIEGGYLSRLSGAPGDTVNPNGLAAIIVSIIPFIYYYSSISWKNKIILMTVLPLLIYALVLTASRSGIICLAIIIAGIIYKSKKKILLVTIVLISSFVMFHYLSPDQKDRYLSIFSSETRNSATAEGRISGTLDVAKLIVRRPIMGYGLGTSLEANANYGNTAMMPHNMYLEVALELGIVGLVIFLLFIKSIILNFTLSYRKYSKELKDNLFLLKTTEAMQVLLIVNLVSSLASYGLLIPGWYLFAGLSTVLMKLSLEKNNSSKPIKA